MNNMGFLNWYTPTSTAINSSTTDNILPLIVGSFNRRRIDWPEGQLNVVGPSQILFITSVIGTGRIIHRDYATSAQ